MRTGYRTNRDDIAALNKIRGFLGCKQIPYAYDEIDDLERKLKHHQEQIELIKTALRAIHRFEWERAYYGEGCRGG